MTDEMAGVDVASATLLNQADTGFRKAAAFISMWAATAMTLALLLRFGGPDKPIWTQPGYDAHHGYTVSLAFVYIPIAVLLGWYRRSRDELQLREIMKAQLQTVAVVGVVWILLDVFFAKLFFLFPVDSAHFPPVIWGYAWGETGCTTLWTLFRLSCYRRVIPFEELLFYLGSAFVLKLMYMWVTEDFFSKYAPARAAYERYGIEPLWKWNWSYAGFGVALFVTAVLVKKALLPWLFSSTWYGIYFPVDWSSVDGWPFYFMAELIILFVPVSGFFDQIQRFTNPRGYLFLTVFTVLISLAWEATLAIPYGWWGYQRASTIGIFVRPWSNIPIEGPWLWISTGTSVMVVYEAAKIKALSRRTWPQALCGVDTWWQVFLVIFGLRRRA